VGHAMLLRDSQPNYRQRKFAIYATVDLKVNAGRQIDILHQTG